MWKGTSLLPALLVLVNIDTLYVDAVSVRVFTSVGDIVGFSDTAAFDGRMKPLTKFLGIPYAEPPVGANRFNKPVPKGKFNTTYQATALPPSCYQTRNDTMRYSEDCLFLNIYVPGSFGELNMTLFPVMIWIHGGAFVSGTSSNYNPDFLSTFGNVVVVTINYRLAALGFLKSADGTFIGNQGLWDQHLAIKWVKTHIQHFHGNRNEITIFGESAGSMSTIAQSLYAGNKGLFIRAIAQSGSVFESEALWSTNAEAVLNQTGCAMTPDPVACLRGVPAEQLMKVQSLFVPVIDGDFIAERPEAIVTGSNPMTSAAREFFGELDILTGVNTVGGAYQMAFYWPPLLGEQDINKLTINRTQFLNIIIPAAAEPVALGNPKTRSILEKYLAFAYTDWSDPYNLTNIRNMVVDLSSDGLFFRAMARTVREHSRLTKGRTYVYELGVMPSYHIITTPSWIKGTAHADDLQYMFGAPIANVSPTKVYKETERNVSRAMMTLWTNFAKTGNPNTPNDVTHFFGTTWPEYDMTSQNYLEITERLDDTPIKQKFYPKRMALWLEMFPEILKS